MKELSNKSKIKQRKQIFSSEYQVYLSIKSICPIKEIIARAGKDNIFSEVEDEDCLIFEGPDIVFDEGNRRHYDLETTLTLLAFGRMYFLKCFSRTNEDKTVNYITLYQNFDIRPPISLSYPEFLEFNLRSIYQ